jgi:hypothetical protein
MTTDQITDAEIAESLEVMQALKGKNVEVTEDDIAHVVDEARQTETSGTEDETITASGSLPLEVSEARNGMAVIYHTQDYTRREVPRNMLTSILAKKLSDGSFAFSARPTGTPIKGTYKCRLHPEHSARAEADELGLPICNSASLISEYAVEGHMASKHREELTALNRRESRIRERLMDERAEREDDFRRTMLEQFTAQQMAAMPTAASPAVASPPEVQPERPVKKTLTTIVCPNCGAKKKNLNLHQKYCTGSK